MVSGIKSKERVATYGEVFTSEKLVSEMLIHVENELFRIDSRFLEPACGTGNFLEPILQNKLERVRKNYKRIINEYEQQSLLALGSIYGIELLMDNVEECRNRLFNIWYELYYSVFKGKTDDNVVKSARFIVNRNIVCGNALTMKCEDGSPIIFSEWSLITQGKMQRKDFCYDSSKEGLAEYDVLLNQYISDYRRMWEYVN